MESSGFMGYAHGAPEVLPGFVVKEKNNYDTCRYSAVDSRIAGAVVYGPGDSVW